MKNVYVIQHTPEDDNAKDISLATRRALVVVYNLFRSIGRNVPIDSLYIEGYDKQDATDWEAYCTLVRTTCGSNANEFLRTECVNLLINGDISAFSLFFRTLLLSILKATSQENAQLQETDRNKSSLEDPISRTIFEACCKHNHLELEHITTKADSNSPFNFTASWRDQTVILPNMRETAGQNNLLLIGPGHELAGLEQDFTTYRVNITPSPEGIIISGRLPPHLQKDVLATISNNRSDIAKVLLEGHTLKTNPDITFTR